MSLTSPGDLWREIDVLVEGLPDAQRRAVYLCYGYKSSLRENDARYNHELLREAYNELFRGLGTAADEYEEVMRGMELMERG